MALGLEKGHCTTQDVNKAIKMVPKALEPYVIGKCPFHTLYSKRGLQQTCL